MTERLISEFDFCIVAQLANIFKGHTMFNIWIDDKNDIFVVLFELDLGDGVSVVCDVWDVVVMLNNFVKLYI